MRIEDINEGDKVVYISKGALAGERSKMIEDKNLGIVTSKNDQYVFVRYLGNTGSQATDPADLYTLINRRDLAEKLLQQSNT